jgi:hypothetical protein
VLVRCGLLVLGATTFFLIALPAHLLDMDAESTGSYAKNLNLLCMIVSVGMLSWNHPAAHFLVIIIWIVNVPVRHAFLLATTLC